VSGHAVRSARQRSDSTPSSFSGEVLVRDDGAGIDPGPRQAGIGSAFRLSLVEARVLTNGVSTGCHISE
jgi:hypothetical protein